jgi:triacylglycerol lipase
MTALTIPKLRSPIVLIHGLFGFGRFQVAGRTVASYFHDIPDAIEVSGNRVFVPSLSPVGGVAQRAQQLKDYLLRHSPNDPVHLLAHSMGGLDARYLISRLGMADHVLTLTTLGTPHRGTSFADWGISRLARLARPVFDFVGMPEQAFHDLTRARCAEFNAQVPDAPQVRYFSIAGRHDGNFLNPEWLLPYHIVLGAEGPNDGVVAVESARYGEHHEVWGGDHFSLVNWLNPLAACRAALEDPRPRYAKLIGRLADLGY